MSRRVGITSGERVDNGRALDSTMLPVPTIAPPLGAL